MQFPGFLHNLTHWLLSQDEGVAKGAVDTAKVEANPVVQAALAAAENAGKAILMSHVGQALGVQPSAAGIATALVSIVDNAPQVPEDAKAPLKMILGGILAGSNFLAPAASSAPTPAAAPAARDTPEGGPQAATGAEVPPPAEADGEAPKDPSAPAGNTQQPAAPASQAVGAASAYKES